MTLQTHKRDWEDLATVDPLWAIYSDPKRKHGGWESETDAFFETGEKDIAELMTQAERLGLPKAKDAVLDFGCGIGRLTSQLKLHFKRCVGVDISSEMVRRATEQHPDCEFIVNETTTLPFSDGEFDLIYTKYVLQHLPSKEYVYAYVGEFARILKSEGLLVFQFRTGLSFYRSLQIGRRLYALLRSIGLPREFIYSRLRLNPIRIVTIPEAEMVGFVQSLGARLLEVQRYAGLSGSGATFFVTKP